MTAKKHTLTDDDIRPIVVYGETANLNYFLDTDVSPDLEADVTFEAVQMPSRSRRQYPGDATPISVSGGTAVFMRDPTASKGLALPGKEFTLWERLEGGGDLGEPGEKRTFTFTGAVQDLVTFFRQNSSMRMLLYSNRGRKYKINFDDEAPAGGGG